MNSFNDAASYARPLFEQLLDRCTKIGIPCRIVDIIRTPTQQEVKLKAGLSWTEHSKHLPQPPENKSEAIDIVPLAILSEHKPDWDPKSLLWQRIGQEGKALGLRWGGDWHDINNGTGDPSHFEYVHPTNEEDVKESLTAT
jgi:hypothetical protein